ncbi:hypothetical protein LKD70_05655 [Ruminococcus sp. CLA-AA-H200]|uniref:Uncharacterized protein n=1 Tax=Ruminococcus turbiniformis TaxID=2881258 RepID=A0ABS8FWB9_9FIRM|nr:hypothetical protein [Ruminococcus turbiniformis]MCC2253924.1 hypothetical protein [Ruminococcus turbiniformis]
MAYGGFPKGVKGSQEKMEQVFYSAVSQAEEILETGDVMKDLENLRKIMRTTEEYIRNEL